MLSFFNHPTKNLQFGSVLRLTHFEIKVISYFRRSHSRRSGKLRMSGELPIRHKRLQFRSWHRGSREADLLLGRFADNNLQAMSEKDLIQFEVLLEQSDPDIWDWISGKQKVPDHFDHNIMQRLKKFVTKLEVT